MKNVNKIVAFLSCIAFLVSCEKSDHENPDFYNADYRIGLWVSPNKKDTLEFVNTVEVIRKGFYYEYEEYAYQIKNNTLIFDSEHATQHTILEVENEKVVLDNMYFTTGFSDNTGTFIKQ